MAAAVQVIGLGARQRERTTAELGKRAAALPALTGLRFVAALWVVLFHVTISGGPNLTPLAWDGYVAVSLFYVLSGFILAYSYLDASGRRTGSLRAFYVARVARLYPAYLAALALATLPYLWQPMAAGARLLMGTLTVGMVQSWAYPWLPSWDGPAWSVSAEMFFYLLFPALAVGLARLRVRHLPIAAHVCWMLALCVPLAYIALNPDHIPNSGGWWPIAPWQMLMATNPLARLPEFCLGLVLGRLFLVERSGRQVAPRLAPVVPVAALAAAVLLLYHPWPYVLLHNGLLDPVLGLIVYGLAWGRGPLSWLLSTPAVVLLGEASYATYLLHYPLWLIVNRAVAIPIAEPLNAVYLISYLALLLALSVLTLRLVEQPARHFIRARWS